MIIEREGSTLELTFNGHGYVWQGKSVPSCMSGLWLSPAEGWQAAKAYVDSIEKKAERKKEIINWERTPLEELELKTRKQELLEFAEEHGVDVPYDKKSPAAIKSFIKKTLEKTDA